MTQRSLRFLGGDLADWQALVAVSVLVAMVLLSGGCGQGDDPVGPVVGDGGDVPKRGSDSTEATRENAVTLTVSAPGIGRWSAAGVKEQQLVPLEPGQAVQFFWRGACDLSISDAPAYRHGWNVQDPDDADDPGWCGPLGGSPADCQTEERIILNGSEFLTIERWDSGTLTVRVVYELWVVPFAPRATPQLLPPAPNP
ncbi:MAG TPA: hypothetical protein PLL30_10765 [Candidatus Krumholzibacteria bacterium]|nr:hypothetical protein [Candidatus Krumholzibacteria bacterium]HPD72245.1 hypothetical protein [Candidatus Krumholzibacteria bacterium]HRY40823.1 hypothetical protein [Candidatus Krumholzibacteria bacterium]